MATFTTVVRPDNTRERLLQAAIAVLETRGEAAIRVDELARSANVSKPSVYHFFGSREGLVVAALAEMYRRSLAYDRELLLEAARSAADRQEFIRTFRAAIASFSDDDGVQRRAFRTEVLGAAVSRPGLQQAVVEMHREQTSFLTQFFTVGAERGFVSLPYDMHTTALWAIAVMLGRHVAEIDPAVDLAAWDRLTSDTFVRLLFGEGAGET